MVRKGSNGQKPMNDYEAQRAKRIMENASMMESFGLKDKAESMRKKVGKKMKKHVRGKQYPLRSKKSKDLLIDDEDERNGSPTSPTHDERDDRDAGMLRKLRQEQQKLRKIASGSIEEGSSQISLAQDERQLEGGNDTVCEVPTHSATLSLETQDTSGVGDKPKGRGPTILRKVYDRTTEERVAITLNEHNQAIGPTKEIINEFTNFLGTIARKVYILPLTVTDWRKFGKDKMDELWKYVSDRYIVPEEGKTWVFETINHSWRGYKSRLKRRHFSKYDTNELRIKHRPRRVPKKMFKALLRIWNSKAHKDISERNTKNRQILTEKGIMHTTGSQSFARLRESLKNEKETKEEPSAARIFIESRKDKGKKRSALDPREKIINELKESSEADDKVLSLFGSSEKKRQRLPLYGRGVSPARLKQKSMEEKLKMQHQEEIKSLTSRYEDKLKKNNEDVRNSLRMFISAFQKEHPELNVNEGMFGYLLVEDQMRSEPDDPQSSSFVHPSKEVDLENDEVEDWSDDDSDDSGEDVEDDEKGKMERSVQDYKGKKVMELVDSKDTDEEDDEEEDENSEDGEREDLGSEDDDTDDGDSEDIDDQEDGKKDLGDDDA